MSIEGNPNPESNSMTITLSGVPVTRNWGLHALVLLLVAGGAWIISRRRAATA